MTSRGLDIPREMRLFNIRNACREESDSEVRRLSSVTKSKRMSDQREWTSRQTSRQGRQTCAHLHRLSVGETQALKPPFLPYMKISLRSSGGNTRTGCITDLIVRASLCAVPRSWRSRRCKFLHSSSFWCKTAMSSLRRARAVSSAVRWRSVGTVLVETSRPKSDMSRGM